jgi:hypothetical protein
MIATQLASSEVADRCAKSGEACTQFPDCLTDFAGNEPVFSLTPAMKNSDLFSEFSRF